MQLYKLGTCTCRQFPQHKLVIEAKICYCSCSQIDQLTLEIAYRVVEPAFYLVPYHKLEIQAKLVTVPVRKLTNQRFKQLTGQWNRHFIWFHNSMFKAIGPFRYRKKIKVHRFTNNFTGFTEGSGERLLSKYYSMKCFAF